MTRYCCFSMKVDQLEKRDFAVSSIPGFEERACLMMGGWLPECRTTVGNFWDERILDGKIEMDSIHWDDIRVSSLFLVFVSLIRRLSWLLMIRKKESIIFLVNNYEFIGKIPRIVGRFDGGSREFQNFRDFGNLADCRKFKKTRENSIASLWKRKKLFLKIREYERVSRFA